jgi:8-oxo-dGTP diphosphatase
MIDVTCALIRNEDDEILIVQRGEKSDHPMKWEFPGGKIDAGETAEECIIREIREELSIGIVICGRLSSVEYDYGRKQIRLIPFICDTLDEMPLLSEHIAFRWVTMDKLLLPDYSEADRLVADLYLGYGRTAAEEPAVPEPVSVAPEVSDEELQAMVNHILRIGEVDWLATSGVENKAVFLKMLEYSFSPDKRLAFRSSWILTKICDKNPELIYPHLQSVVDALESIDNESVLRSFLRILSLSELQRVSQRQHGILAELCFRYLRSSESAIAIKAYSMEILYRLTLVYPELAYELSASLKVLLEDSSAGISARGHSILKKLSSLPTDHESSQK